MGAVAPPDDLAATIAALSEEENAHITDLVKNLQTRIAGVIARHITPSAFTPPDPEPVFIASWRKSGTTLTQQLVYQLLVLTGAVPTDPKGTDFEDISAVVPFMELTQLGPPCSTHAYSPSVWKTHQPPTEFLSSTFERARFLVAVRNGRPVMRSFADFVVDWIGGRSVPPELRRPFYDRFVRSYFLHCAEHGLGAPAREPVEWFAHVRDWCDAPLQGRVLFLVYEDVLRDMDRAVRDVARFLDITVTDAVVAQVVERCSRHNMAGDPRFNDRLVARVMGFAEHGGERVRADGRTGFRDEITKGTAEIYDRMFETTFGVKTYDELCQQLRARNSETLSQK